MRTTKAVKFICPKCKNDTFYITSVVPRVGYIDSFNFQWNEAEVCSKCGWISQPTNEKEKRRRLVNLLKLSTYSTKHIPPTKEELVFYEKMKAKLVDWEGFEIVDLVYPKEA